MRRINRSVSEEINGEVAEIHLVLVEICEALRFVPNDLHGVFCTYNLIVSQADCTYKKACRPQIKPRRSGVIKFRHKPVVLAHDLAQLLF